MHNLKTLVLVRHGQYGGPKDDLTTYGRKQMEDIAMRIKSHLDEGKIIILTSSAFRAEQSAKAIASILGVETLHVSESFWSDNSHYQDNEQFLRELEDNIAEAEHVIVVSHLEYLEEMPQVITKKENFPRPARYHERPKGAGVLLKMTTKEVVELEAV